MEGLAEVAQIVQVHQVVCTAHCKLVVPMTAELHAAHVGPQVQLPYRVWHLGIPHLHRLPSQGA